MSRVIELFLFDILVAILKIEETIKNFDDGDQLKHNYMAWDSVIREFEIIGEATKHLIEEQLFETNKRAIVNFRNVLIHEYFGIDEEEVFDISINKLADLKEAVVTKIQLIQKDLKEELVLDFIDEHKHLEFIVKVLEKL
ncbi:MAG: DUF86 domain-containing protein [Campylobacterales bacterium]|nr:DUF86 domain-containing protein [Campylobacterales bacterium]